jgi:hypothetical protein
MTNDERTNLLDRYATGADAVTAALADATEAELDHRPSPDEWSPRQIVHHLADSETMAYIRLRRLIAEDDPLIQGYDEPEWARRLHYDRPIEPSLAVLAGVRAASLDLLRALTPEEWGRTGTHSESGTYTVDKWLGIYAKHSHEHADQIRRARRGEV